MVAVLFVYGNINFFLGKESHGSFLIIVFYTGVVLLPALALLLYRRIESGMKDAAELEFQKVLLENQKNTIIALREQRHDIINDITLAAAYIQLGKIDEALQCLEFMAANLADKYNYSMLPSDAWLMIIHAKQEEAKKFGIDFQVQLSGELPTASNEQRLLPKLIGNLIDNAFTAASTARNPRVRLYWLVEECYRYLIITNNGQQITPDQQQKIFLPGYTSKKGVGHGWGLVICKRIAEELGGELICESNNEETNFILQLKNHQKN